MKWIWIEHDHEFMHLVEIGVMDIKRSWGQSYFDVLVQRIRAGTLLPAMAWNLGKIMRAGMFKISEVS